jgi:diaminopimelate epimerase
VPGGVNVEWIESLGKHRMRMRVFERGVGETLSCGSGAVAAAVAATAWGWAMAGTPVDIEVRGGALQCTVQNDRVWLTGPATRVFVGQWPCADRRSKVEEP